MLWIWALLLWLSPDSARLDQVEQILARGEYRNALKELSALSERSARWHLLASRVWDGLNDPARAVQEAEKALELEPQHPAHHLQLAQIFLSRNTPKAALEIFTEAQALFPDLFVIRLGKGLALKEMQLYADAERELQWCMQRKPDSALAFDALATVYLHQLRFEELQKLAAEFLKRDAADFRGYYFLAAGRDGALLPTEETRTLLMASIERNPSFAAAHALLGKVLLRDEKTDEAIRHLSRAVELRPDLVQAHLHLARALRESGEEKRAAEHFRIVRELKAKEQEPVQRLLYHRGRRK